MAFFEPILCKWLDLRKYAGEQIRNIWDTNTLTCKDNLGIYYSFLDLKNQGWIYTSNNPTYTFATNADPVGVYNLTQNQTNITQVDVECSLSEKESDIFNNQVITFFMSQRPLMSIPTETIRETVSYSSSLGGVGYRSSYSRVREWHLDFIFRGVSESPTYALGYYFFTLFGGGRSGCNCIS